MTTLVVSQPMFLPWRGIFEQMRLCDVFVFYDDVQLPLGRSFTTRVQVKTASGPTWLSLPVARSGRGLQSIRDAHLADQSWRARHLGILRQAYREAPAFDAVWADV